MITRNAAGMIYALLGEGEDIMFVNAPTAPLNLVGTSMVTKLWEFKMAGGEPCYSSPIGPVTVIDSALAQRQAVLLTSWDWHCYALDVATGAQIWRKATGDTCYGRAQAADVNGDGAKEIFFPSHDGKIWSIDRSAANRWQFLNVYDREGSGAVTSAGAFFIYDTSKAWAANAFMRSIVAPFTENASIEILTGAAAGQIRQISQNNEGTRLWVTDAFSPVPAVGDTYRINPKYTSDKIFMHAGTLVNIPAIGWRLFATSFDNHIYCINPVTGALIWKYATLENIEPYPLVGPFLTNGAWGCAAVGVDGFTRVLNPTTGALISSCATGQCDAFINSVIVGGVHRLVVSSRDNRVFTVNPNTGVKIDTSTNIDSWDYGDVDSSATPVELSDGTQRVLVGGDAGAIWCFDLEMNTKWVFQAAPTAINSSPMFHIVGRNGELCVLLGDMRGTLWCIEIRSGIVLGTIHVKGGIEGVPYYGDIDGDGKAELIVTTIDGYVICYRLLNGSPHLATNAYPGNDRWKGFSGT